MFDKLNAYILTGGSSRRFGSDKAVCKINGVTFLDKIIKTLQNSFMDTYAVGKKPFSDKVEFISDFSDYQASMVGIITALRHTSTTWNFIVSVDMPLITSDIIYALKEETVRRENKIIISSVNGEIFPLFCFYHKDCLVHFEKAFSIENYTLKDVISILDSKVVDLSHYGIQLTNVNTRKQLDQVICN
jgi:molybdopterin-guanine dinucleotide biosynthesis protein A